jgi:hypothetical protein
VEADVIETEDLFLGAFSLARGGELSDIAIRYMGGRPMAFFRISGPGMENAEREYHLGPVCVDLRLLKTEVARLKSLAFRALRGEATRDGDHSFGSGGFAAAQPARRHRR